MVGVAIGDGEPVKLASNVSVRRTRKVAQVGSIAVALSLFGASGALAQNCMVTDLLGLGAFVAPTAAGAASAVAGSLGNISTAFFTQQTSAFVAGATATEENQASGGIWGRAVGGTVATKSETAVNVSTLNFIPGVTLPGVGTCTTHVRQTYSGVQAGKDIAKLNMGGWNVNVGATAGYLQSQGEDIPTGSITSEFQAPFIGGYVVATRGNFFTDVMVRREFYNISLNQPTQNLHEQSFGARGWSVAAGAGYNIALRQGWFIEPSAGFIWSRTQVDPFTMAGPPALPVAGTLAIDNIGSFIGRATVRVGTNFTSDGMAWQPFVSASVFHEFAGNVTSSFVSCAGCVLGIPGVTFAATTETSRVGSYGQLSLGLAGQAVGTGWVGFVRGDYRAGPNIEGWGGTAGLRYNFVPERTAVASKMVTKAPRAVVAAPYDWTGFYVGGHFGAGQGRGHVRFNNDPAQTSVDPFIAGYLLGGQAGYNLQNGPFVIGVEADLSKANINGTTACGTSPGDPTLATSVFSPLFLTCRNALDWIATAAVRLGTTLWSDRTLLFVKAGGAWAKETATVNCIYGPYNFPVFTPVAPCVNAANAFTGGSAGSATTAGGLVGIGAEFGLTRDVSAKAEITYIRFRDRDIAASDGSPLNVGAGVAEAKIGLNYRFGQPYEAPAALIAAPAKAANMVLKAPAPAAVAAAWTGFYVGGSLGGRWSDATWTTTCLIPTAFICPNFFFEGAASNNPATLQSTSFKGGIYVGNNWQAGSVVVVGWEGDIGWANNNKTVSGIPGTFDTTIGGPGLDTATVKQTWDASMRLRGGYLVTPGIMLFATGGVALTHLEVSAFCGTPFESGGWCEGSSDFGPSNVGKTSTASSNRMGYTIGGGGEAMLTRNWLVRAEYRYADYTLFNYTLFIGSAGCGLVCDTITANTKLHTHTASVGLAYKFDWGAVVAKY